MKFSLLIANYNNGIFFKDCYRSIVSQTFSNWEVIIVDDDSTDDSVKMISDVIIDDERFKLFINDKNYGCGYTKRRCVEYASGGLCAFIDPDDALKEDALYKIASIFTEQKDVVLVHSNHYICNEKLEQIRTNNYAGAVDNQEGFFFNLSGSVTAFSCFLKSAYLKTEGIDRYMKRAIDQDLYLKLAEVGKFFFLNECLYLYRQHNNSISAYKNAEKAMYWHWYAINNAAKRRDINAEDVFVMNYIQRNKYEQLLKSIHRSRFYKVIKAFHYGISRLTRKS